MQGGIRMYAFIKQMDHEILIAWSKIKQGSFCASLDSGSIKQVMYDELLSDAYHFMLFEQAQKYDNGLTVKNDTDRTLLHLGLPPGRSALLSEPSPAMLALCGYLHSVLTDDVVNKLAYRYALSESYGFFLNLLPALKISLCDSKYQIKLPSNAHKRVGCNSQRIRAKLIEECRSPARQQQVIQVVKTTAFLIGVILNSIADKQAS